MDLDSMNNIPQTDYETANRHDSENAALTGGIEPGGLRTKSDIRILVCYMLSSVHGPLSKSDIVKICQQEGLANYFEINDAISSLIKHENISVLENGCYQIEKTGEEIADNLDVTLPLSVRDKAMEAAFLLLASAKTERENTVEIVRTEQGYNVTCHISGGEMDLMNFTLYVPDLFQARMVKRNFHRDPEGVYKLLLSSITGNRDLAKTFSIDK
jgi:hypothetical protein